MEWFKLKDLEKRTDAIVAFCLAVAAALAIKVPALFRIHVTTDAGFYVRNLSPFLWY